jgi:hypothetical protein
MEYVADELPKEAVILSSEDEKAEIQIEPSYQLVQAIKDFLMSARRTKEQFDKVLEVAKSDGVPNFILVNFIKHIMRELGFTEAQIKYRLSLTVKNGQSKNNDDKKIVEQISSKVKDFLPNLRQLESDDINETHDQRSENRINDEVKASMPEYKAGHDYDQEQGNDYGLKYDYGKDQKEENKIRFELKQDIEKLRLELDNAIGTIELQRGEIEASKNQKFEARIVDIEESNKTLKIENEQLRHALTKHSFETASEIAIDPELVKNLEHMISHLESEAKAKQKVIEELNAKIQSFSHLDRVVEHQPLEFDLTEKAGFLNQVFSFRYRKCKVIHDGKKVTNITPGVIE